jgi:hypothetical protein
MSKPEGTFKLKRSKTRGVRRVRWQPMVSASSRMPGWVAAGVADLTGLIGNVTEVLAGILLVELHVIPVHKPVGRHRRAEDYNCGGGHSPARLS